MEKKRRERIVVVAETERGLGVALCVTRIESL